MNTITREVSKDEFYSAMNRNVHPHPVGSYPYTSLFKTPDGEVVGKAVSYIPKGSALTSTRYYLPKAS